MGFFNQNDFKYIIKRIIILIFAFLIFSGLKGVLGFTRWEAPNGRTYIIPATEPMANSKYIIYVRQYHNSNHYMVAMYHGHPTQYYVSSVIRNGYINFGKEPYDENTNKFSGDFYAQVDWYDTATDGSSTVYQHAEAHRGFYGFPIDTNYFDTNDEFYVYDSNMIPINVYEENPIATSDIIGTFYPPRTFNIE